MYHHLNCLILREQVSAEADKLITVYSKEWGKISAIVPGAKKIKAKLKMVSEPIVESDFMLYVNSQYARPKVTGGKVLYSFPILRSDWRRFTIAQCCSEIMELLTPFNSENPSKYELLSRTWRLLENAKNPWRIFMAFTLRFLKLSGYSFVDYIKRGNSYMSEKEQEIIRQMATLSGEDVDLRLDIDARTEREIGKYVDNYLDLYLPRPLNTRKFYFIRKSHKASSEFLVGSS